MLGSLDSDLLLSFRLSTKMVRDSSPAKTTHQKKNSMAFTFNLTKMHCIELSRMGHDLLIEHRLFAKPIYYCLQHVQQKVLKRKAGRYLSLETWGETVSQNRQSWACGAMIWLAIRDKLAGTLLNLSLYVFKCHRRKKKLSLGVQQRGRVLSLFMHYRHDKNDVSMMSPPALGKSAPALVVLLALHFVLVVPRDRGPFLPRPQHFKKPFPLSFLKAPSCI